MNRSKEGDGERWKDFSAPPIVINPQTFNVLLLQTSNLTKLEANKFLSDSSTRQDLRQRWETDDRSLWKRMPSLELESIDWPKVLKFHFPNGWTVAKTNRCQLMNLTRRVIPIGSMFSSYPTRKNTFEVEHHLEQTRQRKVWEGQLRDELREICRSDQESDGDSDEEVRKSVVILVHLVRSFQTTDRLEDQPLFHGVVPRIQSVSHLTEKGDYLVRVNEKGRLVLSILWTDNDRSDQLKDGHFFIHEKNHVRLFFLSLFHPRLLLDVLV